MHVLSLGLALGDHQEAQLLLLVGSEHSVPPGPLGAPLLIGIGGIGVVFTTGSSDCSGVNTKYRVICASDKTRAVSIHQPALKEEDPH